MKLRTLLVFGAGVATGLALARKAAADDPAIQHGPTTSSSGNPAARALSTQAQRLADRASVASLDVIRKARGAIRERLAEEPYEDAGWN